MEQRGRRYKSILIRFTGMLWPRWLFYMKKPNRKDLAAQKLSSMQEFLTAHSDPQRAAQLAALRKLAEQP